MFGLSDVNAALSIWDRIKKGAADEQAIKAPDTVASRFVRLFEKHGIHRNQIPRFFDHGLTLDSISSDEKLIAQLSPEILQAAAELFAIRLEWLEGADDQLYSTQSFYQSPEGYGEFLKGLKSKGDHRLLVKLVLTDYGYRDHDALLVIEEEIASLGDESIVRYYLCGGWSHQYYKCRADLAACIAMTLNQGVYIRGSWKQGPIDAFCEGKGFISDLYSLPYACRRDWLLRKRYTKADWHPDHWIYDPENYLDGVDEGDFGKKSALEIWLHYFDKGLLETGYHRKHAAEDFKAYLQNNFK
ncbi:hypothetical protein [Methylotuvimicrobium sp. KM1]|uniref:hypothetical protein n=1 Tax=Methylotuvimicrobium sp. KM1 TaxID=3377707 RepID=UPI00384FEF56